MLNVLVVARIAVQRSPLWKTDTAHRRTRYAENYNTVLPQTSMARKPCVTAHPAKDCSADRNKCEHSSVASRSLRYHASASRDHSFTLKIAVQSDKETTLSPRRHSSAAVSLSQEVDSLARLLFHTKDCSAKRHRRNPT